MSGSTGWGSIWRARPIRDHGIEVHERGTVVVIQGPRFSTKSESKWFSDAGWEVVAVRYGTRADGERYAQMVERTPCETMEWTPANSASEAASCESSATRSLMTLRVIVRPIESLRA